MIHGPDAGKCRHLHSARAGLVVLLAGAARAPLLRRLELAVAAGMTLALAWEVGEYYAFVTRSSEVRTAYADTVGDLALGRVGRWWLRSSWVWPP